MFEEKHKNPVELPLASSDPAERSLITLVNCFPVVTSVKQDDDSVCLKKKEKGKGSYCVERVGTILPAAPELIESSGLS